MSGRMSSPCSVRSPAAKSTPRSRVRQGASAAKRSKRASAAGSRSMQKRVPEGPSAAARRGWCSVGIGTRVARLTRASPMLRSRKSDMDASSTWARISLGASACGETLCDVGGGRVELLLLLRPGFGVPDLQVLAGADHDARPGEGGVLDQRLGDADAAGRVERLVEGAAVEATAQAAGVAAEGAVRGEEAIGELLELLGRVHPDAGVEALGENNPVGEGRAEPRRNREPVLRIETVLVETPKCHPRERPFCGLGRE